jgi:hypothetical protein
MVRPAEEVIEEVIDEYTPDDSESESADEPRAIIHKEPDLSELYAPPSPGYDPRFFPGSEDPVQEEFFDSDVSNVDSLFQFDPFPDAGLLDFLYPSKRQRLESQ